MTLDQKLDADEGVKHVLTSRKSVLDGQNVTKEFIHFALAETNTRYQDCSGDQLAVLLWMVPPGEQEANAQRPDSLTQVTGQVFKNIEGIVMWCACRASFNGRILAIYGKGKGCQHQIFLSFALFLSENVIMLNSSYILVFWFHTCVRGKTLVLGAAGGQSSFRWAGLCCLTCIFGLLPLKRNSVSH